MRSLPEEIQAWPHRVITGLVLSTLLIWPLVLIWTVDRRGQPVDGQWSAFAALLGTFNFPPMFFVGTFFATKSKTKWWNGYIQIWQCILMYFFAIAITIAVHVFVAHACYWADFKPPVARDDVCEWRFWARISTICTLGGYAMTMYLGVGFFNSAETPPRRKQMNRRDDNE